MNRNGGGSRKKSGWADDLVLAPWWVSFGLGIAVFFVLPGLLPSPVGLFCIPFGVLLFSISGIAVLRKWKTRRMLDGQTSLQSICELPWKRFEDLLGEAYRRQGYKVEETLGGGADGGVDLVLQRNGNLILVQCKRWRNRPVPVQAVRELYGVMHDRRAAAGKLVTTSNFTSEAVAFAEGKPIELVGSDALLELLRGVQTSGNIIVGSTESRPTPHCPKCNSVMVMREAKHGLHTGERFWGCSNFPKTGCRGARTLG